MAKQWDADTQSYVEEEYLMEKLHLRHIKEERSNNRLAHEQMYPKEVVNFIDAAVLEDEDLLDIREAIDRRMKKRYGNQYSVGVMRTEFIKPVLTPITPEHLNPRTNNKR